MKRKICLLLAVLLLATLLLPACKRKRELVWVQYGESNDIPCLEISGGEYATYEDYRYILRKANKAGIPDKWGFREKRVRDPQAQFVNRDVGGGVYMTRYVNTTPEIYHQFIEDMKTGGFTVFSEGELHGDILTTSLTYKDNYYTVSYYGADHTIDVTASKQTPLSPHLQKENDSTKSADVTGATLTMRPLGSNSTGYVIQLKNGHFVIIDGGSVWNLAGLLTYLEENTPEGQKPVVEAWFVNVTSYDHTGWSNGFYGDAAKIKALLEPVPARDRISVNGIYYNTPLAAAYELTVFRQEQQDGTTYYRRSESTNDYHARLAQAAEALTTQDGKQTPIYCPYAGQTYYFSGGLTVEVAYTEERNALDDYGFDFKSTSSCYIIRAEGKTVMDLGSANETIQKNMQALYTEGYLKDFDVLLAPWRGIYLCQAYQDVFAAPIVLVADKNAASLTGESGQVLQHYTQDLNAKSYFFSDGTVVYDFATGQVNLK